MWGNFFYEIYLKICEKIPFTILAVIKKNNILLQNR